VRAGSGGASALVASEAPCCWGLTAARRLCLVFLSAKVSALVGVAYLLAVLATAWGLRVAGVVSWLGIWAIMGEWSLVGTSVIAATLLRKAGQGLPYGFGDLVRGQGTLARWGIPAAGAAWVRSDGLYLALAHFLGLAVVAETRAMISLCAPVVQLNSALNASWLVGFSRAGEGGPRVEDQVRSRAVAYAAMMLPGFVFLLCLHAPIVQFVYQGRYSAGAWELPWFYLALVVKGLETLLASALKATTRTRIGYFPQIAGCVACATAAGLAVPALGRAGAVVTVLSASLVGVFVAAALAYRQRWRARATDRGGPLANWSGGSGG
jgi:O-antigen/teichoic acid export membrane protein